MKLKFVAGAVLLATGLGAQATTTVLGPAVAGTPLPFGGFATPGSFGDLFTFTLPANGGSGYSVVNFPFSIPTGNFNVIFSSMALFSNADGILFNGDDTFLTSAVGAGPLAFSWGATVGGSMYLTVNGVATGTNGGVYNGAISVTAVPEPETYAMMLAGLGALGFLARRRNNG